jgi:DNA-binding GntR family transcriptional regulator
MLDKFSDHRPIRDEVFTSLRNAILSGHFKPGERLVEKDLAEQLDISRTPIREALRKLELEGLVAYEPRKGVVVVGVSSDDALEIYMIRAVLEGLAAKLAANKRTKDELNKLKKLLFGMEECIQKDKISKLTSLHASFHTFIAELSKSPRLYQMIISLHDYVKNFAEIPCYLPGRLLRGWEEHKEIVDAIDNRDDARAENAARNHIMQAKDSLLKVILSNEDEALNEKIRSSLGLQP